MITPAYCLTMARYNAWQNRNMRKAMETLSLEALTADRGAFFRSILGTANHLLWADAIWMSRLSTWPKPEVPIKDGPQMHPTLGAWSAERFRMDGHILAWAEKIRALDLVGDFTWFSGATQKQLSQPRGLLVMQVFNHQTHHRGQIHAMLTQAGCKTEDTDLPFMPSTGPWM